jgi:predicted nuclease with RNAse H fold/dephospho-CoA kinase
MQGEAAPILWHKYRKGDLAAMNRLIEYNHADVEGMKVILDYCIEKYFEKDQIPKNIRRKPNFSIQKSHIRWTKDGLNNNKSYKIFVPPFTGSNKPLITYEQLSHILPLDELCIIGIDLVSSEDRETGVCILEGNKATTCRLKTDDELIKFSIENGADIVSIDSPLSIPKGRTSFFDDDPFRDEFGITRECERLLKRRGISSYPCLIPSMQKLTRRGMILAQKFRSLGVPVIESYPGAAQDIMSIPRKQAGLDYLIEGLKEFGISGDFIKSPVTHDELDAITSAIVGLFFWAGMYEALGNPDEEYLIIPDLNADYKSRLSRIVVGLSGEIATGKTAAAEFLKNRGFSSTRYSKILEKLLLNEDISPSRTSLQKLGWKVNQEKGQRWLGKKILDDVENKKHFVVDGLRFLEDHALMVETYGPSFNHIHLKASLGNRKKRVSESMQKSLNAEVLGHRVEREINQLERVSHIVIMNDGTLKEFFQSLKNALGAEKEICQ